MRTILLALLIAVLFATALGACFAQAPGLVSFWPGNGNYQDVVGGNNGTPVGGVGFSQGIIGSAFAFDGETGHIFVPDSPSLAITGSLALSAWIFTDGIPVDSRAIAYAGIAPGFAGLYQINLTIPASSGSNPEIRLAIGDAVSLSGLHIPVSAQ